MAVVIWSTLVVIRIGSSAPSAPLRPAEPRGCRSSAEAERAQKQSAQIRDAVTCEVRR
jgi:hypothetical protein